ncbi:hypothetical protein Hanom_Chr02g00113001 [Helianthus anomalus]
MLQKKTIKFLGCPCWPHRMLHQKQYIPFIILTVDHSIIQWLTFLRAFKILNGYHVQPPCIIT